MDDAIGKGRTNEWPSCLNTEPNNGYEERYRETGIRPFDMRKPAHAIYLLD